MTVALIEGCEEPATLDDDEREEFRELERIIEDSKEAIGKALAVIRNRRLYRETHGTFEDYCRERWGIGRSQANRAILTFEVGEVLAPMGATPNERQARELAPLRDEPERMREVYEAAVEATGGKVTAKSIKDAREGKAFAGYGPAESMLANLESAKGWLDRVLETSSRADEIPDEQRQVILSELRSLERALRQIKKGLSK